VVLPILQIACFEKPADQIDETVILDLFPQNVQQSVMVDPLKTRGDICLDDPFCPHPVPSQAFQCSVTTSSWAESMAVFMEVRFIDGFQYQPSAFLNEFIPWGRNP
jgi:hypothetical protein